MTRTNGEADEYFFHLWHADALAGLEKIDSASVDAVITDPPYPGVFRQYGKTKTQLREEQWHDLMDAVIAQVRRVLTATGSAVFILQPVGNKIGSMSLWLPEFLIRTARKWNWVRDHWWYNNNALPGVGGADRRHQLCRGAMKHVLWFGAPDCYRNQDAVLVPSAPVRKGRANNHALYRARSGRTMRYARADAATAERGGRVPDNVVIAPNSKNATVHPAITPLPLADWWVRYISKPGDIILDPFTGSGTVGVAALHHDRHFLGIEKEAEYVAIANDRLADAQIG